MSPSVRPEGRQHDCHSARSDEQGEPEEAARRDPPPVELRYLVNDTTVEKLSELLNQNPNGLLLFPIAARSSGGRLTLLPSPSQRLTRGSVSFVGYPWPRLIGRDQVFSLHWCASPWISGSAHSRPSALISCRVL